MKLRLLLPLTALLFAGLANAQVVINEVYYDSPSTDIHCFTEIKGNPGTDLTGYWLVGINGNVGTSQGAYDSVQLAGTIPASGYFVLAQDNGVANYNQISTHSDWQNASGANPPFSGDNLLLKNPSGQIIDALGYGDFVSVAGQLWMGEPSGMPSHAAPDPFGGPSLARIPDGNDTNDNSIDFQSLNPPTPGANNGGMPTPVDRTLLQIRMNTAAGVPVDSGTYVRVHGVANVPSGLWTGGGSIDISIQDGLNAGVTLRGISNTTVAVGDSITCNGYVTHYNGKTQITGPFLLITNHGAAHVALPDPIVVTTGELRNNGESYEGMLVRINGAILGNNNPWPALDSVASINVDDGTGIITLRIEKGTDLDGWTNPPQPGDRINITGIAGQFDYTSPFAEFYQISPRGQTDVVSSTVSERPIPAVANGFALEAAYPNPFNRSTEIRFQVPHGEVATLAVYDISGRLVSTLGSDLREAGKVAWNGRNASGSVVTGGMYFVRLTGRSVSLTQKAIYLP